MKNVWVLAGVCFVVLVFGYNVQAHPHRSIEDTEEDSSSESDPSMTPVVHPANQASEREPSSNVRGEMTSHEKSHENDSADEEERNTSTSMSSLDSSQRNSDEDDMVKFPKTESLCPARPEEITNIEMECAQEYQQWKEHRARKEMATTTSTVSPAELVETVPKSPSSTPAHETMSEDMKMSTIEEMRMTTVEETKMSTTTSVTATAESTTTDEEDMMTTTTTEPDMTTTDEMMTTSARTQMTTMMMSMGKRDVNSGGSKHRRSVKRKRSCYPPTCILKKLKLLDSMGQLNSKQIQKFAVNMSVDDSTNLEQKAAECVKEINEAMVDSSADIGKKVGCVAQKIITCLNKGLTCPIVKVQH